MSSAFWQWWNKEKPSGTPCEVAETAWGAAVSWMGWRMAEKPEVIANINGQPISKAYWQFMIANCDDNAYDAAKVLYRAKKKSEKVTAWITKGFLNGYATSPCDDEENNTPVVIAWIDRWLKRVAEVEQVS